MQLRACLVECSLVALATCFPSCESSALPPPPLPELSALDPAVAEIVRTSAEGVRSDPRDARRWERLGNTYAVNGFDVLAEACYDQALALAPKEARLRYLRALVLAAQGRTADAVGACEGVERLAPDYAPAWRQRGSWRLDLGRAAEALSDFQRACALEPSELAGTIGVAQSLLALGRAQEAAERLTEIRRQRPDSAEYVDRLLATALQRLGKFAEAERLGDRPYVAVPRGPDPWIHDLIPLARGLANARRMALRLLADRRYADAVSVLESARPYRADDARTRRLLAQAYAGVGRAPACIAVLREAAQISPDNAGIHRELAERCARAGDLIAARSALETALALEPDDPKALAVECDLLMRETRFADARLSFRRAVEGAPHNADLRIGLALACAELRQFAEVCDAARKALELDPDRAAAWACLALALLELGQPSDAARALERARALAPQDPFVKSVGEQLARAAR